MTRRAIRSFIALTAILIAPAAAFAQQEAVLSGTVRDTPGGVLPGVVVRAVHEATGNSVEVVTDSGGVYQLAVRVGIYRITAELSGFATVTRAGLEVPVGQQVTNMVALGFGQPRYSRDAIGEFEFVANRVDASQGRSMGVQVNAVTKSGTNQFAGTVSSYFRSDTFNVKDHVVGRVLPYSDQQVAVTSGGPIQRDRFHFFGNYEFERDLEDRA